jgi:Caspase domain
MRWLVAITILLATFARAEAKDIPYAIIIGNNAPPSSDLRTLRYADDDAVRYYQVFGRFAETRLLVILDAPTQKRYPGLASIAMVPTTVNLEGVVEAFRVKMETDRQRGDRPVLYFVFSGHGSRDAKNEPYLALLDGALTQRALYETVLARMPAVLVHVIVDACHAGGVVGVRGGFFGKEATAKTEPTKPADVEALIDATPLAKYPHIGVLVATTLGEEAHEWSEIESGVFTHELLSGLLGAADVNGDRVVEYSEVEAFVAAANRDITDARAVPHVIARPPATNRSAPLVALSSLANMRLLQGDASQLGHFYVELANGQRYLDAHLRGGKVALAIPDDTRAFLRTRDREASLPTRGAIAFADVRLAPRTTAARGSIDDAYRASLWASDFGRSYYQGFVDSVGGWSVQFAVDDAPARSRAQRRARDKKLAIGSLGLAGIAGLTSITTGILAYRAKSDFDGTQVQAEAEDAQARYERYLPIAIGTGVVALGAGALAYWLWPKSETRVIPTASSEGAGVSVEIPW